MKSLLKWSVGTPALRPNSQAKRFGGEEPLSSDLRSSIEPRVGRDHYFCLPRRGLSLDKAWIDFNHPQYFSPGSYRGRDVFFREPARADQRSRLYTVCLGIAVDDTIHFLTRYTEERKKCSDNRTAIHRSFTSVGGACIMTTLVLVCGFSTVFWSDTREHHIFATMGATIAFALIGDLTFFAGNARRLLRRRFRQTVNLVGINEDRLKSTLTRDRQRPNHNKG